MNAQNPASPKPNAIAFCIAYRRHLERHGRSEFEQPEPDPRDFGMPPSGPTLTGAMVEHPLAEALRRDVHAEFERHAFKKAMERQHISQ